MPHVPHQPGAWDDAARRVEPLSAEDLDNLWRALALEPDFGPQAVHSPERTAVLVRGATLHADVAMLRASRVPRPSPGAGYVINANDGRSLGIQAREPGWAFARRLLDGLRDESETRAIVRSWYRATIAYMARHSRLADAEPQLAHARGWFTADADLLCDTGWYWEAMARPEVQAVFAQLEPPIGTFAKKNPSLESALEKAESFFSQALQANSAHLEARLRRGRVRTLLGHDKEAVDDLTPLLGVATDPEQRYLVLLFLGAAHEGLKHTGAARDAYVAASQLFPEAHSPYLALSRLSAGSGDMHGARRALQDLLAPAANGATRPDPRRTYALGSGRHADDLLSDLYAAVGRIGRHGGGSRQ